MIGGWHRTRYGSFLELFASASSHAVVIVHFDLSLQLSFAYPGSSLGKKVLTEHLLFFWKEKKQSVVHVNGRSKIATSV